MQKSEITLNILWIFQAALWTTSVATAFWNSIWFFREDDSGVGVLLIFPTFFLILYAVLYYRRNWKSHKYLPLFMVPTFFIPLITIGIGWVIINAGGWGDWSYFIGVVISAPTGFAALILSIFIAIRYKKQKKEQINIS